MPIFDDVSAQMKDALRAKESRRLTALRSIRAVFLNELKKDGSESLADEACVPLLRRLEKQHRESIEAFENAGRDERVAEERAELEVIQQFLPQLADEGTTAGWVEQAIDATGAAEAKDLGKVMGALMRDHKGEIDGALAKRIAGERLRS